jgi:phospholipid/cholesterol/gamma-HCH transport system substrate-binding protein
LESKANYALIGTFVLIAFFGAMAFFAYLSGKQFDEKYNEYTVVYDTPPRGISIGSEVRLSGLKRGEVVGTDLEVKDDGGVLVLVTIRVNENTPIYTDTYGQLEPLGLTGLSYIQLLKGDSNERLPEPDPREPTRIEGRASQFDNLLDGSDSVIDNVNLALTRAIKVLGPEATEDFHGILSNINDITASINESNLSDDRIRKFMDTFEQTARDISTAALAIDTTANDISVLLESEEIQRILAQTERTIKTAEETLNEYTVLAKSGTDLTDETLRTIEQFSSTGLQDLSLAMADLKMLIDSLNRVSESLERSPLEFIVGQEKELTELPQ